MSRKRGKVDFLTEGRAGEVVPLEVKSGASVRAHASLEEFDIPRGIVLSRLNIEVDEKVVYLPWYAQFCLDEVLLPEAELPKI